MLGAAAEGAIVSLMRFPPELVAEIQELDRYRYVLVNDECCTR